MSDNREYEYRGPWLNGFVMLLAALVALAGTALWASLDESGLGIVLAAVCFVVFVFLCAGLVKLEPNVCCVLTFFGKYSGTFRRVGYHWINPLLTKRRVSLRIRNLDLDPIKVNDRTGNPIMIGLVLVWRIRDTYRAVFDLDTQSTSFDKGVQSFVAIQSDAALREVAAQYAYDDTPGHPQGTTLRDGGEQINRQLETTLDQRLQMAGIEVVEARINYLAYAPEIAAVMLRRQQADAIITARERIVEGAVSMVKMALDHLESEQVVSLDNDRRAQLVGNLLVVLCSDDSATPVVNAGN